MIRNTNPLTDVRPSIGHKYNACVIRPLLKKTSKILDIGCWSGQLHRALSNYPGRYYGIDIPEASAAIDVAKQLSPKANWRVASALELPFKPKSFNVVTLLDVIEHLPINTEHTCLSEINRVLVSKGLLIFSTPADNLISKLADPAYFLIGHRHYHINKLTQLFKTAGFTVQKKWTTGAWWHVIYYWTHLAYKHFLHIQGPTFETQASKELGRPGFLTHYFILSKP
jgi:ubiquinone/menaquinone biosynthesis C-methylase UbiE